MGSQASCTARTLTQNASRSSWLLRRIAGSRQSFTVPTGHTASTTCSSASNPLHAGPNVSHLQWAKAAGLVLSAFNNSARRDSRGHAFHPRPRTTSSINCRVRSGLTCWDNSFMSSRTPGHQLVASRPPRTHKSIMWRGPGTCNALGNSRPTSPSTSGGQVVGRGAPEAKNWRRHIRAPANPNSTPWSVTTARTSSHARCTDATPGPNWSHSWWIRA